MKRTYLSLISIVDHLHRQFLDLVSTELERIPIQDINSVQAILLFNIGTSDLTVGELTLRGCYLGSNVSYNVKKLVEADYLMQRRSPKDRRTVRVRLTPKGLALCAALDAMHERHLAAMAEGPIDVTMSPRRSRPCAGSTGSGAAWSSRAEHRRRSPTARPDPQEEASSRLSPGQGPGSAP